MVAIRGHFDGSVFVPDERVGLPRNQQVLLHVEIAPADVESTSADLWDVLSKYTGSVQAPSDWEQNTIIICMQRPSVRAANGKVV